MPWVGDRGGAWPCTQPTGRGRARAKRGGEPHPSPPVGSAPPAPPRLPFPRPARCPRGVLSAVGTAWASTSRCVPGATAFGFKGGTWAYASVSRTVAAGAAPNPRPPPPGRPHHPALLLRAQRHCAGGQHGGAPHGGSTVGAGGKGPQMRGVRWWVWGVCGVCVCGVHGRGGPTRRENASQEASVQRSGEAGRAGKRGRRRRGRGRGRGRGVRRAGGQGQQGSASLGRPSRSSLGRPSRSSLATTASSLPLAQTSARRSLTGSAWRPF